MQKWHFRIVKWHFVMMNITLAYFGSRGFITDGAARGEAKLAWAIPSRDRGRQSQTCLSYAEISCKREQSQACLAMPSAADIQRS